MNTNIMGFVRSVAVGLAATSLIFDASGEAVGKSTPAGFKDDLAAACSEAARSGKMVLAVFDGSDWSSCSKLLWELHLSKSDFVEEANKDFVLAFIDNPKDKSLLSEVAKQNNEELFRKYKIIGVPSVKILKADGSEVGIAGFWGRMTSTEYVEQLRHTAKYGPIVAKFLSPFEEELNRAAADAVARMFTNMSERCTSIFNDVAPASREDEIKRMKNEVMVDAASSLIERSEAIRAKVVAANIPPEIEEDRTALLKRIDIAIQKFKKDRMKFKEGVNETYDGKTDASTKQKDVCIPFGLKAHKNTDSQGGSAFANRRGNSRLPSPWRQGRAQDEDWCGRLPQSAAFADIGCRRQRKFRRDITENGLNNVRLSNSDALSPVNVAWSSESHRWHR